MSRAMPPLPHYTIIEWTGAPSPFSDDILVFNNDNWQMVSYSVTQYSLVDTACFDIIYLPNYTVSHTRDTRYPYPAGPHADGFLYTRFL